MRRGGDSGQSRSRKVEAQRPRLTSEVSTRPVSRDRTPPPPPPPPRTSSLTTNSRRIPSKSKKDPERHVRFAGRKRANQPDEDFESILRGTNPLAPPRSKKPFRQPSQFPRSLYNMPRTVPPPTARSTLVAGKKRKYVESTFDASLINPNRDRAMRAPDPKRTKTLSPLTTAKQTTQRHFRAGIPAIGVSRDIKRPYREFLDASDVLNPRKSAHFKPPFPKKAKN